MYPSLKATCFVCIHNYMIQNMKFKFGTIIMESAILLSLKYSSALNATFLGYWLKGLFPSGCKTKYISNHRKVVDMSTKGSICALVTIRYKYHITFLNGSITII